MSQQLRGRRSDITLPLVEESWKRRKLWHYGFRSTKLPFHQSLFCRLPKELRDEVYKHYFTVPGGFTIHRTGDGSRVAYELRTSAGEPIDHALRQVCKDLADETEQFVFEYNTISSVSLPAKNQDGQEMAYHWDTQMEHKEKYVEMTVRERLHDIFADRSRIMKRILRGFPQYEGVLEEISGYEMGWDDMDWDDMSPANVFPPVTGEGITARRRFLSHACRVLGLSSEFTQPPPSVPGRRRMRPTCGTMSNNDCWEIPASCNSMFEHRIPWSENFNRRFSAAAVMIDFLRGMNERTRIRVRKLDIHEDRQSIALPECHAQGLVQFYCENPKLRINRRVNVWKAMVPSWNGSLQVDALHCPRLDHLFISLQAWIAEAKELKAYIPAEAFTLTLYCNSLPNRTKQVLDIVQEQAAWEIVKYELYKRDARALLRLSYHGPLIDPNGFLKQGLKDIAKGTSNVKCKFDVGKPVDPMTLLDNGRWSQRKFEALCDKARALRVGSHTV